MGFFDDLKASVQSGADDVKKSVKLSQLQSELNDLKRDETSIYAEIGKTAVSERGTSPFGENGEKLVSIQEKIAAKDAEIAAVNES